MLWILWITIRNTRIAPVVNGLTAACNEGFVPTDVYVLDNPVTAETTVSVESLIKMVVAANAGGEPDVSVETIDDELEFEAIIGPLSLAMNSTRRRRVTPRSVYDNGSLSDDGRPDSRISGCECYNVSR